MRIKNIIGREILDSRGYPTIEVDIILFNGNIGRSSVPSGTSIGNSEFYELRDKDRRYFGHGVKSAVNYINGEINSALYGYTVEDQKKIDRFLCELDGTTNKSRFGANTILAVSLANAKAFAIEQNKPLYKIFQIEKNIMPVPMINIINGGLHANNNIDFQEFMIMPINFTDFSEAIRSGAEIFYLLKQILKKNGLSTSVGIEGGFSPDLKSNKHALDIIVQAINKSDYILGKDIFFALDIASSHFYNNDGYYYLHSENKKFRNYELIEYYETLCKNYPIISIEDGIYEQDLCGWQYLTNTLGHKVQLVGDDLFVTNITKLQYGIKNKIANAIIIKPNQIGTLTETLDVIKLAKANNYNCIISHRSGETEDTFIADLAVAIGVEQIKIGSLCRSERVAKYNQLLRINEFEKINYIGNKIKINFMKN